MPTENMYDELHQLATPVDMLQPHPNNYNHGDVDAIAESLTTNGMYKPVIYQKSTGYVLAGNHTLLAARKLGWSTIAAIGIEPNDATAKKILAVDNQSARLSTFDDAALMDLLDGLPDLEGTGFTDDDLADLLAENEPPMELPPAPAQPLTELRPQPAPTSTDHDREHHQPEPAAPVPEPPTTPAFSEMVLMVPLAGQDDFHSDLDAVKHHLGPETTATTGIMWAARIAARAIQAVRADDQTARWILGEVNDALRRAVLPTAGHDP